MEGLGSTASLDKSSVSDPTRSCRLLTATQPLGTSPLSKVRTQGAGEAEALPPWRPVGRPGTGAAPSDALT